MAHFAKLDNNNVVTLVIIVDNKYTHDSEGVEHESLGVTWCKNLYGSDTVWKQTSYNNRIRGNYAGIGHTYMENVATLGVGSTDIFIFPQEYPSWIIDTATPTWKAPISQPSMTEEQRLAGCLFYWNETEYQGDNTKGWELRCP